MEEVATGEEGSGDEDAAVVVQGNHLSEEGVRVKVPFSPEIASVQLCLDAHNYC